MRQIGNGPTPAPLPPGGSPGQVLGLDAAGKLAWLAMGSGGGETPPGAVAYSRYRLNVTANSGDAGFLAVAELALISGGANVATGGTASASSTYSDNSDYLPSKAFDGNLATVWFAENGVLAAALIYTLATPKSLTGYAVTAPGNTSARAPKTWTLQGSNDGTTWVTLHAVADAGAWAAGQTKTYTI